MDTTAFHQSRLTLYVRYSDIAKDLIRRLIQLQPENRLDTDGILQHPWILKYNKPLKPKASSASLDSTEKRTEESPRAALQEKKNDAFGVNSTSTRRKKRSDSRER